MLVKSVAEGNNEIGIPRTAGNGEHPRCFNETEAAGIIGRVANGLQPGVVIGNQVAVVVEPFVDVAQTVQNPIGGDGFADVDGGGIGVEPLPGRVAVGLDFVGHGGNFVTHGHDMVLAAYWGVANGASFGCPDVKIEEEIIMRLNRITPGRDGAPVGGFGITERPILIAALARGQTADDANGVLGASQMGEPICAVVGCSADGYVGLGRVKARGAAGWCDAVIGADVANNVAERGTAGITKAADDGGNFGGLGGGGEDVRIYDQVGSGENSDFDIGDGGVDDVGGRGRV